MNIRKRILLSCFVFGLVLLFGCKEPPIIDAVKEGKIAKVEEYLKNNGDPNLKNRIGDSLIMLATYHGYPAIVEDLIKAGADVNDKNDRYTVLDLAFYQYLDSDTDTIGLLLEAGAHVTDRNLWSAASGLWDADIVRVLLEAGADPNGHGNPPLLATSRGSFQSYEKMQFVLKAGADVNARNKYGETALMRVDRADKMKLLLASGADINATDQEGNTVLMKVAENPQVTPEMIQMLLKSKADVNATNKRGWTALMKASELGYTEIIKILLKAGANVNAKNIDGDTAISIARHREHADVVKVLKAADAKSM